MAATDDLTGELIKFNAFLAVEDERVQQERALKKAVRLREEAAGTLKTVMGDAKASKEDKDAAETAWKEAVATEERVQAGGPLVVKPEAETETADTEAAAEAAAETETQTEAETAEAAEPAPDAETATQTEAETAEAAEPAPDAETADTET